MLYDILNSEKASFSILSGCLEGILIAEINSKMFMYGNPAICKMLGYTADELLNLSVNDIHPENELDRILGIFMSQAEGNIETAKNLPCLRKDGSIFIADVKTSKVVINDISYNVGLFTDVSERQDFIKELKRSKDYWESIFNGIPHPTVILDLDNNIISANNKFKDISGSSETDFIGKKCWRYFHSKQSKTSPNNCPYKNVIKTKENHFAEMEVEAFGGIFIISCTPIFNDHGELEKILHIATDITKLKSTEIKLASSINKFRTIVENIDDAFFIHQFDGKIIDVNSSACKQLGYSKKELIGNNISQIVHNCETNYFDTIKNLNFKNESVVFESKLICKNDILIDVLISLKPVSYDGQKILHSFARDISDYKKTEKMLQNTQKLESIGILAGGIAHDFNNLLTGIYNYLDLAYISNDINKTKDYIQYILNTMDKAKNLTQQLITFSKGGKPNFKTDKLNIFLKETVEFASSGSNCSVHFFIQDDLWVCNYDANQLSQVIQNIVINARQSMNNVGKITVKAKNLEISQTPNSNLTAGKYVLITISDNGIGISDEIKNRIFDPFFTTKDIGTGLGLTTSYSIIKKHKGSLEFKSKLNEGTSFQIYLPASDEIIIKNESPNNEHRINSGKILIMDDEEVIRKSMGELLESYGFTPILFSDGKDVINRILCAEKTGETFDAIILDLTVPRGMGGKEAISEIRKINKTIPVIVTSGYSTDSIISNYLKYGFTDSLIKPFKSNELISIINKNVNQL